MFVHVRAMSNSFHRVHTDVWAYCGTHGPKSACVAEDDEGDNTTVACRSLTQHQGQKVPSIAQTKIKSQMYR